MYIKFNNLIKYLLFIYLMNKIIVFIFYIKIKQKK